MNNSVLRLSDRPQDEPHPARMGQILEEQGKITLAEAESIVQKQREHGIRFGEAARLMGLVLEEDVQEVLAYQFGYRFQPDALPTYPPELVAIHEPKGERSEMLRALRTYLRRAWLNDERKEIVISSPDTRAGVSCLAANLAIAAAQVGDRVLLVDANLRRPVQARMFSLANSPGLSDVLAGRAELDAVQSVRSIGELSVLTAGTAAPNPHELLHRSTLKGFAKSVANRFDMVIYDACAYSAGSDVLSLGSTAGGVLLLSRRNHTRAADIKKLHAQLGLVGAALVGTLMTNF